MHHKRPRTEPALPALPVLPAPPALHAPPTLGVLGVSDADINAPPSASKSCSAEVDLLEDLYGQDAHRHNDPFQGLCV
jgi:hypothetical protein